MSDERKPQASAGSLTPQRVREVLGLGPAASDGEIKELCRYMLHHRDSDGHCVRCGRDMPVCYHCAEEMGLAQHAAEPARAMRDDDFASLAQKYTDRQPDGGLSHPTWEQVAYAYEAGFREGEKRMPIQHAAEPAGVEFRVNDFGLTEIVDIKREGAAADETCWLVERTAADGSGPWWLTESGSWTGVALEARRFATEQEARAVAVLVSAPGALASEHIFWGKREGAAAEARRGGRGVMGVFDDLCPGCGDRFCSCAPQLHPVIAMLADLRGGIPSSCDFCDQPMAPEDATPEEGGQWACIRCFDKWAAEDRAANEEP